MQENYKTDDVITQEVVVDTARGPIEPSLCDSLLNSSQPPRSPPASLTTPPPRSTTLTPGPHYATAPVLSTLRSKRLQQLLDDTEAHTANWLEISSSTASGPMSGVLSTFAGATPASLEGGHVSGAVTTFSTSENAGVGAAPSVVQSKMQPPGPRRPTPPPPLSTEAVTRAALAVAGQGEDCTDEHVATATESVTTMTAPVARKRISSLSTSSSSPDGQPAWRPPWMRGRSTNSLLHRRPGDGSNLNYDLPTLNPNLNSPFNDTTNSVSTPALSSSAAPSHVTTAGLLTTVGGCGGDSSERRHPPSSTASRATASLLSVPAFFSAPSSPDGSTVRLLSPSSFAPVQQQQQMSGVLSRRPPSPPLLPPWVYAVSEHLGPQLPSPGAPSAREEEEEGMYHHHLTTTIVPAAAIGMTDGGGGEVATLRVNSAERGLNMEVRRPSTLSSLQGSWEPLLIDFAAHRGIGSCFVGNQQRQRGQETHPSHEGPLTPIINEGVMVADTAGLRFWTTYPPRTRHSAAGNRSGGVAPTSAVDTNSSPRAGLPAFFTPTRRLRSSAPRGVDWRLERAVQPPPTSGDREFVTLEDEQHSLASLYAAYQMTRSDSLSSSLLR